MKINKQELFAAINRVVEDLDDMQLRELTVGTYLAADDLRAALANQDAIRRGAEQEIADLL